jgi:hypothetical protein
MVMDGYARSIGRPFGTLPCPFLFFQDIIHFTDKPEYALQLLKNQVIMTLAHAMAANNGMVAHKVSAVGGQPWWY